MPVATAEASTIDPGAVDAAIFTALGEPSRLRIVAMLHGGPSSVGDIADVLHIRQPQVSKHLRVLSDAGIVACDAQAKRRIYRLESAPFHQIGAWVDSFEHLWGARLDSLGSYLGNLESPVTKGKDHGKASD